MSKNWFYQLAYFQQDMDAVKIEYEVNKRANFLLKNNVHAKDKVIIAHGGGPNFC